MIRNEGNPQVTHSIEAGNDSKLTFSNFVANFRTLLTMLRSSFFSGFFSIFRYKFIWRRKKVRTKQREIQFDLMIYLSLTSLQSFTMAVIRQDCWCVALCVCQDFSIRMCVYLFGQQNRGIAVLLISLSPERGQPQQEDEESGAPHQQLPVTLPVQERVVAVQHLQPQNTCHIRTGAHHHIEKPWWLICGQMLPDLRTDGECDGQS